MIMSAALMPYAPIIVLLTLAGVGIAGFRALRSSRVNGSVDYFLGGRMSGWWVLSGSFFVTALWAVWCTGVEMGFRSGVWLWTGLGAAMAACFLFVGLVLAPAYRQGGAFTLPSLIGEQSGSPALGATLSVASTVLTVLVRIPLTILLAGRMMQLIFGWDPVTAGLLIIVVPGVFAVAGGYAAVFAVQSGAAVAAVAGLIFFGSSGALDMMLPASAVPGLAGADPLLSFVVFVLVGLWSAGVEQSGFQRVNASASSSAPRRALIAVAGAMIVAGLAVGVGAASRGTTQVTGGGWTGLATTIVGTSLLMAAIASLASHFMSASTLITMDLFTRIRRAANESVIVLVGRLMSTVVVVFSILASSLLAFIGDTAVLWLVGAFAVIGPPLAVITVIGVLRPGRHAVPMLWGLGAGWAAGASVVLQQGEGIAMLSGMLWTAFAGGGLALVVTAVLMLVLNAGVLASYAGAAKDAK